VIEGNRILTNAHVVQDETMLRVTKEGNPKKFRARLAVVAHDLDLAMITVDEPGFWSDLPHAEFAEEFPELYSEVKAVGFPTGGATVCVTKGIVSRVDAHVYVHPRICGILSGAKNAAEVLVLQIDAAINPGNSGGPTFDTYGKVVGVASSGLPSQQNVGYIIPARIARMFITEFYTTGRWSGISEPGFDWGSLESSTMRRFLKMGTDNGVLVEEVAPLGAINGQLNKGDIITHIDGLELSNEGDIPVQVAGQKIFLDMNSQITKKAKGETTTLRILRNGEAKELIVAFAPIPSLAPRFQGYDSQPDFVLIGGLVFTRVTVPLHDQYLRLKDRPFISDHKVWRQMNVFKKHANHELVMLLTVLEHDVNLGYGLEHVGILDTFNEQKIQNLTDLARFYGEVLRAGKEGIYGSV